MLSSEMEHYEVWFSAIRFGRTGEVKFCEVRLSKAGMV